MGTKVLQITSLTIVYSTVCSGSDQRKHQCSASLAFVRTIHRWPVNSPHKGPVMRRMTPFDDVIMNKIKNTNMIRTVHSFYHEFLQTKSTGHETGEAYLHDWPGGRFKNAYELLNLRALKISMLYKNCIFQCMGNIFCVEFQRVPLKFHTKYLPHTLKDVDFIQRWKFKSS